ncbi:DUF3592 domain-containing protein [Amycolatopsis sp. BJA-103]|uniref:DUF3592 domain-containing protein n=1 Tax=Amycolatopsis sp. BJA-103 TaxID=1911175 RepID=UPI000C7582FF|nr:DUF3592 domain-containing protein [Amycolatopsis sp. BJA-103]
MGLGDGETAANNRSLRVRALCGRSIVLALLWIAIFAAAALGTDFLQRSADELLATGSRAEGTVESVRLDRTGKYPTIIVGYRVDFASFTATIDPDSGRAYTVGQPVTVIYDPANPRSVRTLEEANKDGIATALFLVLMLLSLVGAPASGYAAVMWWLRYRAVLATGWRAGKATVWDRKGRKLPDIDVKFEDGAVTRFRAVMSTRGATRFKEGGNVPVSVAGTGQNVVLVFPDGRWRTGRPYEVPVREARSDGFAASDVRGGKGQAEVVPEERLDTARRHGLEFRDVPPREKPLKPRGKRRS